MKPRHALVEVKALARAFLEGDEAAVAFSAPGASIKRVVRVLLCSEIEAVGTILNGVLKLDEATFSRSFVQWEMVVDEYGLENFLGHNWYVKLAIGDENGHRLLDEISFHPLERPMRVKDGRLLGVTFTTKSKGEV